MCYKETECDHMVDLERGVELAVHHVFGEHVTIQYCFLPPDPILLVEDAVLMPCQLV